MSQGWEAAVAAIGAAVLGLGLAALAGLGVAARLFGGGWVWPHGTDTIGHVLGGVLSGQPGRGLPPAELRLVPGPAPVYGCIAVCELLLIAAASTAAVVFVRYHRPGDARGGMATRSEAATVLGVGRLRGAKKIIRPDLYGGPATTNQSTDDALRSTA